MLADRFSQKALMIWANVLGNGQMCLLLTVDQGRRSPG